MFVIQILSFGHYTIAQRSTVFRFVYWFLVSLLETEFPKFSFTANHLFSYLALLVWNSNCHRINNWNSIVVELTGCSIFPELELGTQCVVEMSGQQTILQHPTTMDKIERWVICWEIFFFKLSSSSRKTSNSSETRNNADILLVSVYIYQSIGPYLWQEM